MEKFTLDEAFDILYTEALEEQLKEDIDDLLKEQEEQAQFIDSLRILNDAMLFEVLQNGTDNTEDNRQTNTQSNNRNNNDDHVSTKFGDIMAFYDKMSAEIDRKAAQRAADTVNAADNSYKPAPLFTRVEKFSDMKFPQNIIFFITQLLKWIKNNILNFIDKFSNVVRSLLGLEAGKGRFSKEDLKLKFNKAKDIETKYLITGSDAYKNITSFEDKLNKNFDNAEYASEIRNNTKTIQLYDIPLNQARALTEDYNDINIFSNLNEAQQETSKVISIDTSKDLFALKQSLEHFYDLFDNAYGSNDEKLFGIEDLEVMIELFKQTYNSLFSGKVKAIEVSGSLSFESGIDANKLKENLLRTRINTDNLKKAYVVTNKQINNISQIIMSKHLLGAADMGVSFAFLSASTYQIMIDLLDTINVRLREAKQMEKKLAKMKTAYENLVKSLEQRRASINAVSGITMTTVLQRRINELYDGARYMTQTVQLRMSALSLYISELNDTRVVLRNLNTAPEDIFSKHKKFFKNLNKI